MSTCEINEEEILTSKSEGMELSECLNRKQIPGELEIVYSDVEKNTENPVIIESVILDESLPKIVETRNANDSSCVIMEQDSIETDNAAAKNTTITLSDSRDDVECLEISEVEVTEIRVNDAASTDSTFGLVPQDSKIDEAKTKSHTETPLPSQKKDSVARAEIINTVSSLSCLAAEYATSDEESDEEVRAPSPCELITIVDDADYRTQSTTEYRTKPTINVSDSEDSDSDSSDESSSSSSSDSESSDSEAEDG